MNIEIEKNSAGADLLASFNKMWPNVGENIVNHATTSLFKEVNLDGAEAFTDARMVVADYVAKRGMVEGADQGKYNETAVNVMNVIAAAITVAVQNMFSASLEDLMKNSNTARLDTTNQKDMEASRIAMLTVSMPLIDQWAKELPQFVNQFVRSCIREHLDYGIKVLDERLKRDGKH